MNKIKEFAQDIRGRLETHFRPACVTFRGSFATNKYDEYSDIDLQARIARELNERFYSLLEHFLKDQYGPALIRYDPDYRADTATQGLRISFYERPIFWRVDLDVASDRETARKWPHPFPEWSVGNSALMNVVWAVKYDKRGKPDTADHYLFCACDKLKQRRLAYTSENALVLLAVLGERTDTNSLLVSKLREAILC